MMVTNRSHDEGLRRALRWPLRLTRAGLVAERITRCFWQAWSLLLATLAALALGFQERASVELFWLFAILVPAGLLIALYSGFRQFRWPTAAEAQARLDATLPGRPLAALSDEQALGVGDEQSRAVWRAHLERMRARLGRARAPAPDLRLSARDPFALRYSALVALIIALMFGSLWRLAHVLSPADPALAAAPAASWEGWVEPPAHTGKPTLYLGKIDEGSLDLPKGSRVILRLYGPPGAFSVKESLSFASQSAKAADANADPDAAPPMAFDFIADHSGTLAIAGEGGRTWTVTVLTDQPPSVALTGEMDRKADGRMSQPFAAKDDFAIAGGEVRFELDLAAVDRRFGLAPEPEPQPALVYDLPLPMTGKRAEVNEILAEDASEHPWANLPVIMTLTVRDALGQTASTEPVSIVLPGRRFFDPLAAAVIEMRRDLLWSRANSERADQILRAVTNRPEGFVRSERAYLSLRVAVRRLTAARAQGLISKSVRDDLAKALWDAAVLIEDGGLADALERMKRAQDRLSEAMKNGASKDEIAKLMDELRQATDDYLNMLAERGTEDPADQFTKNNEGQPITDDQISQMMDEIQRLMNEGRMAEAQELLEQFKRMMQNMRVTQSEDGEGGRQRAYVAGHVDGAPLEHEAPVVALFGAVDLHAEGHPGGAREGRVDARARRGRVGRHERAGRLGDGHDRGRAALHRGRGPHEVRGRGVAHVSPFRPRPTAALASRSAVLRAMSARLSCTFLPFARPSSTLQRPSLKYTRSGTSVYPSREIARSMRSISRMWRRSFRERRGSCGNATARSNGAMYICLSHASPRSTCAYASTSSHLPPRSDLTSLPTSTSPASNVSSIS
jgi:uncharacterized protein (TIGR02302 family)